MGRYTLDNILVLTVYELKRLYRKMRVQVVLALGLLPTIIAMVVISAYEAYLGEDILSGETAWQLLLGLNTGPGTMFVISILNFSWLLGLLIAVDAFSGEFEVPTFVPLLSKPIARYQVAVGKTLAASCLLAAYYALLFLMVIAFSWVAAGPQAELWLVPMLWLAALVGTLGISMLTMLFSLLLKKTTLAAVTTFAIWLANGIVISMIAFALILPHMQGGPSPDMQAKIAEVTKQLRYYELASPFSAFESLLSNTYYFFSNQSTLGMMLETPFDLIALNWLSCLLWLALFQAIIVYKFEREDIKV